MSVRPSIHDIAAMPYPQSLHAMRQYYDPQWGMDTGDGAKKTFRCVVEYEIRDQTTVDVEAFTPEEAKDLAADKVAGDLEAEGHFPGAVDIGDVTAAILSRIDGEAA